MERENQCDIRSIAPAFLARYEQACDMFDDGNIAGAVRECEILVQSGYPRAHFLLGTAYFRGGPGIEARPTLAAKHFQQALDEAGLVEAAVQLGRMKTLGVGIAQDLPGAKYLFGLATKNSNHPVGWMGLGRLHLEGWGVERSLRRSIMCYHRAYAQGYPYALTMIAIAMWRQGHWVRSVLLRLRAAYLTWRIVRKNARDWRLEWF
jgi:TPR repeat protein